MPKSQQEYAAALLVQWHLTEDQIPSPNGCRSCGIDQLAHYQRWSEGAGRHGWIAPSDRQRLERMRDRRKARQRARLGLIQPDLTDYEERALAEQPTDRQTEVTHMAAVVEYAVRNPGTMTVRRDNPPWQSDADTWVRANRRFGPVYQRRVIVVEDWKEVPDEQV